MKTRQRRKALDAALDAEQPLTRRAVSNIKMAAGNERRITVAIIDGRVRRWVGIGWVDEGEPTAAQRKRLPTVEAPK